MKEIRFPADWGFDKLKNLANKSMARNPDFSSTLVLANSAQAGIVPQSGHFQKDIAAKQKQKKWLIQNLLTGKLRLAGFCGEREQVRLGDYLVEHNEVITKNNQYPILTSSRRGIFLQLEYYTQEVAGKDNVRYNRPPSPVS